ncbi:uncharacterized protein LOC121804078 [Salvia splendens]|uniref:uncharacterized protein LOC121804078 n=1 Tax=Salvia splendens TaxID=180675 RepID=UPI001C274367|nr:uncharacterized protein LOC121804078 [Salvia splendens]
MNRLTSCQPKTSQPVEPDSDADAEPSPAATAPLRSGPLPESQSLVEALQQMSNYAKFLKDVVAKKRKKLNIDNIRPTSITLQMADRSTTTSRGIVEDVLEDKKVHLIIGRSFLATGGAMIDVQKGELTLRMHNESITFNIYDALKFYGKEGAEGYQECSVIQIVTDCVGEVEVTYHQTQDPLESFLINSFTPTTDSSTCDANVCAMIAELEVLPKRIPQKGNAFLPLRTPEEEEERKKALGKPRGPHKVELKPLTEHLRLGRYDYHCFLDGYSGYNQIAIAPEDQHKSAFSVFGKSYDHCLDNLAKAFEDLKKALVSALILITPDWSQPFEIMCNASDIAVGSPLGQKRDKIFRVIYYASRTLDSAQVNYTTTERKMLAIVYSFDKFKAYLVGTKTIVYTNHAVIRHLLAKKDAKPTHSVDLTTSRI